MTPVPIRVPLGTPAAPATFELAGTGELEIKSVTVTIDGSGAGSAFFPTLSVYTQDNRLVSRTQPSTAVAAGSSAVVTWAPFLRKPAAVAAAGGISTFFLVRSNADQFVNNGDYDPLLLGVDAHKVGSPFTTADHKTFTLAAGVWAFGYQAVCEYTSPGGVSETIANLVNAATTGIEANALVTDSAQAGDVFQFTVGATTILSSVTEAPTIQFKLANATGATIRVDGSGYTYLWGALLKAA